MMAEFARHYLINHSHNLSDVDGKFSRFFFCEFLAKLRERLQDPEEEVRKAAIDAACEVAEAAPDHISENTMLALRDRLRDKKVHKLGTQSLFYCRNSSDSIQCSA